MKTIIEQAISRYGCERQTVKAIEELSELQKELCKAVNGTVSYDNIAEEMADVQIMFWQLQSMYHVTDEALNSVINYKLERLKRRMENEETISTVRKELRT